MGVGAADRSECSSADLEVPCFLLGQCDAAIRGNSFFRTLSSDEPLIVEYGRCMLGPLEDQIEQETDLLVQSPTSLLSLVFFS